MKVLIGTKNAGKVEGLRRALAHYFDDVEIESVSVPSNVPEQPVNDETLKGAENRVKNLKAYAKENGLNVDLYASIESGLVELYSKWFIMNFAVIADNEDFESCGTSSCFPVPDSLVDKIKEIGLGEVMNQVFTKDDDRHNRGGGIQLLTNNIVSRIDITETAFVMALTKYLNKDSWNK